MKQNQILETIRMIEEENLDIRTITMGISLLDCIDSDIDRACEKIYQKITSKAKNLVKIGNEIGDELGIPIINKRVSVTPIAIIGAATDATDYTPFALALDRAAKEIGIDFIGGFTALAQKAIKKVIKSSLILCQKRLRLLITCVVRSMLGQLKQELTWMLSVTSERSSLKQPSWTT